MAGRWGRCLLTACALGALAIPGRIDALDFNLIPNGDFDDDGDPIDGWDTLSENFSFLSTIEEDDDECVGSLAASVDNFSNEEAGDATSAQFLACAPDVVAGESYILTGRFRFPTNMVNEARMTVLLNFSAQPNCTGSHLEGGANLPYVEHENANGLEYTSFSLGPVVAPEGTDSADIRIVLQKEQAADNVVYLYFDKIYFTKADFIFSEDFEFDAVACRWSIETGFAP